MKIHEIDDKIKKFVETIKTTDNKNSQEYLTEIEVLKREREKFSQYKENKSQY